MTWTIVTAAVTLAATGLPGTAPAVRFLPADSGARIIAQHRTGTRQLDLTVKSPALPKAVKVRVLLPKGWKARTRTTWPVVFAYQGGQDDYTSWSKNSRIRKLAAKYKVIVVMPEAADGSYTDWYNYGKGGRPKWETFHTADVVQLIARNYHANRMRAAIGDSAGGLGAIAYAARHRGLFRYVASLSGVLSLRSPGMPELAMLTNASNGQDPFAIWGIPHIDEANWKKHDPVYLAPRLRGTGIFFSAGTTGRPGPGDPKVGPIDIGLVGEAAVGHSNREFKARLDQLGIPYRSSLYGDGRHNWPAWNRVVPKVWPTLMKAVRAKKA
ncbi:MAG: alpha/beta hydrolase-fold protein [Streptosporangiaceae bacterium]